MTESGNGKAEKTLVTFLLDRTGSMASVVDDTIGGFNKYIDDLKTGDGNENITFNLIQFDSQGMDKLCVLKPIAEAPKLDQNNYIPRANTPLIEASFKTIRAVEKQLTKHPEYKRIVITIQTDGQENWSGPDYTWDSLKKLVEEKTAEGWQFNFMGAGIDAYQQARHMGVAAGSTMSYDKMSKARTESAFASMASNTRGFSSGMSSSTGYTAHQKLDAGDVYDHALKKKWDQRLAQQAGQGQTAAPKDDLDLNNTPAPPKAARNTVYQTSESEDFSL
jgi:hypothetical protein